MRPAIWSRARFEAAWEDEEDDEGTLFPLIQDFILFTCSKLKTDHIPSLPLFYFCCLNRFSVLFVFLFLSHTFSERKGGMPNS